MKCERKDCPDKWELIEKDKDHRGKEYGLYRCATCDRHVIRPAGAKKA